MMSIVGERECGDVKMLIVCGMVKQMTTIMAINLLLLYSSALLINCDFPVFYNGLYRKCRIVVMVMIF